MCEPVAHVKAEHTLFLVFQGGAIVVHKSNDESSKQVRPSEVRAVHPLRADCTHSGGDVPHTPDSQDLASEKSPGLDERAALNEKRTTAKRLATDWFNHTLSQFWAEGNEWASNVAVARRIGIEEKGIRQRRDGRKQVLLADVDSAGDSIRAEAVAFLLRDVSVTFLLGDVVRRVVKAASRRMSERERLDLQEAVGNAAAVFGKLAKELER